MNQILVNKLKKNILKFKIQFFISLISMLILVIYSIIYFRNSNYNNSNFSNLLLQNFSIKKIYNNSNYTTIELNNSKDFNVVGSIKIPKINIEYPILSTLTDDLLKISPCRFYGPYPNQKGNLCIAAHNYDDNRFFGNLNKLDIGDEIKITDSNNKTINYYVYDKFEVDKKDTSCTSQNTNGKRLITLVTCNNISKTRLIVKAKE